MSDDLAYYVSFGSIIVGVLFILEGTADHLHKRWTRATRLKILLVGLVIALAGG